jgi:hypothetical protein
MLDVETELSLEYGPGFYAFVFGLLQENQAEVDSQMQLTQPQKELLEQRETRFKLN